MPRWMITRTSYECGDSRRSYFDRWLVVCVYKKIEFLMAYQRFAANGVPQLQEGTASPHHVTQFATHTTSKATACL